MDIKDNKFLSDNTALSDNLNDSTIGSNNQILANNELNVETRGAVDAIFDNVLELICMPKEKFKQIKSGLMVKQIENCQKILMKAEEIKDKLGIDVLPPPLKFSIPFMNQAACEYEEEMYNTWAKLLVEAATEYNPIQLQYANMLSAIGSDEAKLLKEIYIIQKQIIIRDNIWEAINAIAGQYGQTYSIYYNGITLNKKNLIDVLYPFNYEQNASIILLEKLGLVSKFVNQRLSSERKPNEPVAGLYLTEFGYSMVDCLEREHNATEKLSK